MSTGLVYEPIMIGNVEIPNRIVRTAHGVPLRIDGGDELLAYHRARARGGVGLSILGIAGVHPTGPTNIPVFLDSIVPAYQRLSEALHVDGMKVMQQLWHGGAVKPNALGGAPLSASQTPSPSLGTSARPMTKTMIDEMVEAFATAAGRCQAGGLDGVQLHAAHGYLISQFLSPVSNNREDEYGGSFDNRMRFLLEILAAIRDVVGPDFAVGVRLSADEMVEKGLDPEETGRMALALEPLVEFIDISVGSLYAPAKEVGLNEEPLGYELEIAQLVTRRLTKPTIVTGRIMTMDHAAHIVESGIADLVSMVRALIADPEIVRKTREDRTAEIRPCIGTNQGCVAGTMVGNFHCVVNPLAGRELTATELAPVDQPRRVLVVGGGPGGMEAARTAAIRGHDVALYEMKRSLGGQVPIAAKAPRRADLEAITSWQADELERLGVSVHLRTPVDDDLVAERAPDVLVVATGSEPRRDGHQVLRPQDLPGADLPHVCTSWDVFGFGGRATIGTRAVVYDDVGSYEPLSVADALVARGVRVTYVTRMDGLGAKVGSREQTATPILERLAAADVHVVTKAFLTAITPDAVEVQVGAGKLEVEADTVVLVGVNEANTYLAEIGDRGFPGEVYVIGDANGPQSLANAIHQGYAAGLRI